ncbi:hypothetical protein [Saccharothrix texasensis]|uniref:Uncharacterized protein n=1 Tax=Saccharothrix texasensis TaxID=103734 RepID=A0A3N1HBW1_9PSEU|nr:hypothetical protein [Saccharothrix texasensis]ROP39991.1 hypothetical protein EDD40_5394 [Saccharothrix texasensis]
MGVGESRWPAEATPNREVVVGLDVERSGRAGPPQVPAVWSAAAGFRPWWTPLWHGPVLPAAVAGVAGFRREALPVPRASWVVVLVAGVASVVSAPALST